MDSKELSIGAIAFLIIVALVCALWVAQSHFEARAFERATGKHVSTFDAMFIELRVQEATKADH